MSQLRFSDDDLSRDPTISRISIDVLGIRDQGRILYPCLRYIKIEGEYWVVSWPPSTFTWIDSSQSLSNSLDSLSLNWMLPE